MTTSANGGVISVVVQGKDVGLSDLLARITSQANAAGQPIRNYASAIAQLDPATKAAQGSLAAFAQAQARLAVASGDTVGAVRLLASALQQLTPNTSAALSVQTQLQSVLSSMPEAADRGGISLANLANAVIAIRGAFEVATQIIKGFGEVINQGNELEKTETSFRVLSGTAVKYAENMQEARNQQALFGGTLNDTIEGMTEFANLSNRTGIEITKLTNLARGLATVDPAQ